MAHLAPASAARRLRGISVAGWLRLAVIGCAALAAALALLAHTLAPTPNQSRALIGQSAPAFTLAAAQSDQTLAQPVTFAGHSTTHPTLLVFFNTLCVHCVAGVQAAQAATQTPDQSTAAIIYLDSPGENAEITRQYMARLQANPPVLLDKGAAVAQRYGVAYYPTIILVDAQGVVRAVWVGAPSASELAAAIARSQ
jgi:peroxiredoxin